MGDLKPENILLSSESEAKIIDFGSAKSFANGEQLTTKVFTTYYVAPEVLTRKEKPYTELCDVWSLGVILYMLLCGRLPFKGDDDMETMKKVKKGKYSLEPSDVWSYVSADAVD